MVYIKAISYYLPENQLTTEELQQSFPYDDIEKLSKAIGVKIRHIASSKWGVCTSSDMAVSAVNRLFEDYNIDRNDIDFLKFCAQSPDYFMLSTSCFIQNRLNLSNRCGAFGFDLGCSGYVYLLAVADSFVKFGIQ